MQSQNKNLSSWVSILLKLFKRAGLPLLLVLFLAVPLASGAIGTTANFIWETYQNTNLRNGFNVQGALWTSPGLRVSLSDGTPYQMLSFDADNNSLNEIIGSTGNFLRVYSASKSSGLVVVASKNMGAPQQGQMTRIPNYDADEFIEWAVKFGDNISIVEYNGSVLSIEQTLNISETRSGLLCDNFTRGTTSQTLCYVTNPIGTIIQYDIANNSKVEYALTVNASKTLFKTPPHADIDFDGRQEIVFPCDRNFDGKEGICVWDEGTKVFDTSFSVDGIEDPLIDEANDVYGIALHKQSGSFLILVTGAEKSGSAGADSNLFVRKASGALFFDAVIFSTPTSSLTPTLTPPVIIESTQEVCVAGSWIAAGGNVIEQVRCFSIRDVEVKGNTTFTYETPNFAMPQLTAPDSAMAISDLIPSRGGHEIIFGGALLIRETPTTVTILNYTTNASADRFASPILTDLDNDRNLEVCTQISGRTACIFSDLNNAAPVLTGTNLFGQNFETPVCVGTSVTFTATEEVQFTNDFAGDKERMVSNCGVNNTLVNGSFVDGTASQKVTFACLYALIGSYSFDMFLQDNANLNNFSAFQTISLNVINGTPGVTCNLPVSPEVLAGLEIIVVVPADQITSEAELKEAIEIITGQSDFIKGLLSLIITMAVAWGMFRMNVQSPLMYGITIFFIWLILATLGLLSWVIVMIFAIIAIGMGVVAFILGRSGEEG